MSHCYCFKVKNDKTNKNKKKYIEYNLKKEIINTECIICLQEISLYENVILIDCGHLYHKECISNWFKKRLNCPICNFSVD